MIVSKRFFIGLYVPAFLHLTAISAQTGTDTLKVIGLEEVEVKAERKSDFYSASPSQTINSENFIRSRNMNVADIARQLAGVQVKDYGGVGGLKTVSLRSLGASYTGVAYDGIPISDCQTGQIDLGRFALDNLESVSIDIGESSNIFIPAKMQTLAGLLNISTRKTLPVNDDTLRLNVGQTLGSFGLLNPAIMIEKSISKSVATNFSVNYLQSDGDYPYRQTIGYNNKTVEYRRRNNSAVKNLKSEFNIFANLKNGAILSSKFFGFFTDRQLPMAVYYNDYSVSSLRDNNVFVTLTYRQAFSSSTDLMANTKISVSQSKYFAEKGREYLFFQREHYANTVLMHKFGNRFAVSLANDLTQASVNTEGNNVKGQPARLEWLCSPAAQYLNSNIEITAKLLTTIAKIDYPSLVNADDYGKINISPYIGTSFNPFNIKSLRIRAFYKNTYRQPTLSDIFYAAYSPKTLKPEIARQFNVGAAFLCNSLTVLPRIYVSADLYHYKVKDKIVAYPTDNMYIWTMINIGKVDFKGIDLRAEINSAAIGSFSIKTGGVMTFQNVRDKTNPNSRSYNKLPVYTPKYSGSAWISLINPFCDVHYTVSYIGKRYFEASNPPTAQMAPVVEQSLALSHELRIRKFHLTLSAECINIADVQYEIVRSYPMEGRNFRFKLTINN